jgi:hypothetical protein
VKPKKQEPLLPSQVASGVNRDDMSRRFEEEYPHRPHPLSSTFVHGDTLPAVGQVATVQVDLLRPMRGLQGFATTWFLVSGLVVEVMDRWRIRAELTTSTDNAPRSLHADWDVVLTYDGAWLYPWRLVSMRRRMNPGPILQAPSLYSCQSSCFVTWRRCSSRCM